MQRQVFWSYDRQTNTVRKYCTLCLNQKNETESKTAQHITRQQQTKNNLSYNLLCGGSIVLSQRKNQERTKQIKCQEKDCTNVIDN